MKIIASACERSKLIHRSRGPGHSYTATNAVRFSATVYLAAPIPTYGTPAYTVALAYLTDRYPFAAVLAPHDLWISSAHWRSRFRATLSRVTHLAVLTDDQGFVGAGVFEEWWYLHRRVAVCLAIVHHEVWERVVMRVVDADDWRHHARIINLDTGQLSASSPSPVTEGVV